MGYLLSIIANTMSGKLQAVASLEWFYFILVAGIIQLSSTCHRPSAAGGW